MADVLFTFSIIAVIIILGYLTELLFKKTGVPDVLFLIGAGIFLNSVLGWVDQSQFGFGAEVFATFALIFILFQGSLNIEFKTLFATFRHTTVLTVLSFILTTTIVTLICMFFLGLPFSLSLLVGMALGGTSSAVVIPLVNNLDSVHKRHKLILTVESAISDVLVIIGALTIIGISLTGNVDGAAIFRDILSSFSLAIVVGFLVGLLWIHLVRKSHSLRYSYILTIAVLIGLYAFVESPLIGASGAIAALAFGLALGNSKYLISALYQTKKSDEDNKVLSNVLSPSAKTFYEEISFFVKVFFFVYLGILMDFSNLGVYLWAAVITLAIYLIRPIAVSLCFRKEKLDVQTRTGLEVLIPKGLAAAVLAQLAVARGVPGGEKIVPIILAVIFLSIVLSAVLIFLSSKNLFKGFYSSFFSKTVPIKTKVEKNGKN